MRPKISILVDSLSECILPGSYRASYSAMSSQVGRVSDILPLVSFFSLHAFTLYFLYFKTLHARDILGSL